LRTLHSRPTYIGQLPTDILVLRVGLMELGVWDRVLPPRLGATVQEPVFRGEECVNSPSHNITSR